MVNIEDPNAITISDDPMIVFCNQQDIISDIIDWRTDIKGVPPEDHVMLTRAPGKFVCQSMGIFNAYREIPMNEYMVKGTQLAFVQLVNSNPDFVKAFNDSVTARLAGPWWTKTYDYIGVFGQLVGADWIHTPGLRYCSVDVIRHLVNACPELPKADQQIINNIPPETNPEVFRQITINNPGTFFWKYCYTFGG